ncbi:MAG: DUF488 domain-containing protein [Aquificae bacterium]|nr:DUF488 domain-containing protein [Aquificota bacterium]
MLFTIGYSGFFEIEKFLKVLKQNQINLVIDIRTFPYSKTFPNYDQKPLKTFLKKHEIDHMFLGTYLGGQKIKTLVKQGITSTQALLKDKDIKKGMKTLYKLSREKRVSIMCAEKEPFDCHRLYISYLFYQKTKEEIINLFPDKQETVNQTINRFKKENKLDNIDIEDEKLISERFKLLYKIQNKREERYPEKPKNLKLF